MSRTSAASRDTPDPLRSIPELAEYLGVPIATIYRWRYTRDGPVCDRLSDVERWLENTTRQPLELATPNSRRCFVLGYGP